ncbi:YmfQ family protein [Pseudomonas sp. NPDC090755]|uniref:YmfQ family protein n=1 Tax=Pseudomonas sp. NPDC090755 TaxID=3364481 RepID=UPI00383B307F
MVALRATEEYREQLQALLPVGPAWDPELAPEVDAILAGMATELARIDGRVVDLVGEMDPATTTELLADWERVAGLPDKCAGTLETTVQGRRNALLAKLTATGGQSKAYFIALAATLGYTITIEEFRPFRAGLAVAGGALTNGGWMFTWRVRAPEVTVIPFRAGRSSAGEQLRAWGNDTLECKIRKLAPAHTVVLFSYEN